MGWVAWAIAVFVVLLTVRAAYLEGRVVELKGALLDLRVKLAAREREERRWELVEAETNGFANGLFRAREIDDPVDSDN